MKLFCTPTMEYKYAIECQTQYERIEPLQVQTIPRGIVFPLELSETNMHEQNQFGGVCDENLKFVELSLTKRVSPPNFASEFVDWFKGANPAYTKDDLDYVDESVVFIGALPKHFGHYILEGLSRLWFLLDQQNLETYRCVCISDDDEDHFAEFLRLFGLPAERITRVVKPTMFKEVIVPEQSIRLHDFYTKEYKATIEKIMANVHPVQNDKVYFSKKERKNDRAIGERPLEHVLACNGYSVYYPERMSVGEVLSVVKGCNLFAATSGTNIHNSLFLRHNSRMVCLSRSGHYHPIQIMIDRMNGLNVSYVDAYIFGSRANWSNGPFFLFPTNSIRRFFSSEAMTFNALSLYGAYPRYLIIYMIRLVRRYIIETLRSVLSRMQKSSYGVFRHIANSVLRQRIGAVASEARSKV